MSEELTDSVDWAAKTCERLVRSQKSASQALPLALHLPDEDNEGHSQTAMIRASRCYEARACGRRLKKWKSVRVAADSPDPRELSTRWRGLENSPTLREKSIRIFHLRRCLFFYSASDAAKSINTTVSSLKNSVNSTSHSSSLDRSSTSSSIAKLDFAVHRQPLALASRLLSSSRRVRPFSFARVLCLPHRRCR